MFGCERRFTIDRLTVDVRGRAISASTSCQLQLEGTKYVRLSTNVGKRGSGARKRVELRDEMKLREGVKGPMTVASGMSKIYSVQRRMHSHDRPTKSLSLSQDSYKFVALGTIEILASFTPT